jgi:hypothetical protein
MQHFWSVCIKFNTQQGSENWNSRDLTMLRLPTLAWWKWRHAVGDDTRHNHWIWHFAADDEARQAAVVSKPTTSTRWLILFIECLIVICAYFTFDIPSAIKSQVFSFDELLISGFIVIFCFAAGELHGWLSKF